jgi:hypothetical protein
MGRFGWKGKQAKQAHFQRLGNGLLALARSRKAENLALLSQATAPTRFI